MPDLAGKFLRFLKMAFSFRHFPARRKLFPRAGLQQQFWVLRARIGLHRVNERLLSFCASLVNVHPPFPT
jgi:hypothetical protein